MACWWRDVGHEWVCSTEHKCRSQLPVRCRAPPLHERALFDRKHHKNAQCAAALHACATSATLPAVLERQLIYSTGRAACAVLSVLRCCHRTAFSHLYFRFFTCILLLYGAWYCIVCIGFGSTGMSSLGVWYGIPAHLIRYTRYVNEYLNAIQRWFVLGIIKNGIRFVTTSSLNRCPGQGSHSQGSIGTSMLRVVQAEARAHRMLQIWHDRWHCWQLQLRLTSCKVVGVNV
jgi:hypothetical protein